MSGARRTCVAAVDAAAAEALRATPEQRRELQRAALRILSALHPQPSSGARLKAQELVDNYTPETLLEAALEAARAAG